MNLFRTEEDRRDARSAVLACAFFYLFLFLFATLNSDLTSRMPETRRDLKVSLLEPSPQTARLLEEKNAALKQKPVQRESVVANVPKKRPAPHLEQKEIQRSYAQPAMWSDERSKMDQKTSVEARPVDMPDPVSAPTPDLANRKMDPIQEELADVKQSRALSEKRADFKQTPTAPADPQYVPNAAPAPSEIARRKATSDFRPEAQAAPQEMAMSGAKQIQRNIAQQPSPASDIPVQQSLPAPDLPAPSQAAPAAWAGARTVSAAQEFQVQPGRVALPVALSDRSAAEGSALSEKARPVEAVVSSVKPNVELRRVVATGPAPAARPVSSGHVSVIQVPAASGVGAPVEVVRKDAPSAVAYEPGRQVQVDGLLVSDAPAPKNTKDRMVATAQSSSAPSVPQVAASSPSPDLPATPAVAPEKWVDAARADRPQLAERASMAVSTGAVALPTRVADRAEIFDTASARYDVSVEDVVSEFDILTLSDGAPPASPPSASLPDGSGEGSTRRNLIKSDPFAIPQWYEEKGVNSVGTFRIHISAEGDVKAVDVEKTTGFKDIDAGYVATIMNWKYEKAGTGTTKLLKVRIKLRKW